MLSALHMGKTKPSSRYQHSCFCLPLLETLSCRTRETNKLFLSLCVSPPQFSVFCFLHETCSQVFVRSTLLLVLSKENWLSVQSGFETWRWYLPAWLAGWHLLALLEKLHPSNSSEALLASMDTARVGGVLGSWLDEPRGIFPCFLFKLWSPQKPLWVVVGRVWHRRGSVIWKLHL